MHQAGLTDISVRLDPYHLYAGTIDADNDKLWQTKLDIARPNISRILGSDGEADAMISRFMSHLRDPATLTYSVIFTASGLGAGRR